MTLARTPSDDAAGADVDPADVDVDVDPADVEGAAADARTTRTARGGGRGARDLDRMRPEDARPPLRAWGHVWRYLVCLLLTVLVWWEPSQQEWRSMRWLFWTELVLGAVAFVAVAFRRRWPLGVALLTNLLTGLSGVAGGPAVLATVSVSTLRRPWPIAAVAVTGFVCAMGYANLAPGAEIEPYWVGLVLNALLTLALVSWGLYVGSRRELMHTLRQRAARAEAERELRGQQARTEERARIAREMHDVLAHRISQISMHAGALSYRTDLDADALRAGAAEIQGTANHALTDLRTVLGVLRDSSGSLLDRPQPTYADLAGLVADVVAGGMHVELVEDLSDAPPEAVGRAVYRIVQEGLTNARKHAPGATVWVRVSGNPESGLLVELRNPLGFGASVPGSGVGLIGLRERAELRGGHLEHRREGGTFVLRAWLPWTP